MPPSRENIPEIRWASVIVDGCLDDVVWLQMHPAIVLSDWLQALSLAQYGGKSNEMVSERGRRHVSGWLIKNAEGS